MILTGVSLPIPEKRSASMTNDESPWATHPLLWAAGLAGAMVSLAHMPNLNLRQRLLTLGTGTAAAGFITPALADWWNLTSNLVALTGFIVGMTGMSLTAVVCNTAMRIKEDPDSALRWLAAVTGRTLPPAPNPSGQAASPTPATSVPVPLPNPKKDQESQPGGS